MKLLKLNFGCKKCNSSYFYDCGKYHLCNTCFSKVYKKVEVEKLEVKKVNIPIDTISYNKELFAKNVTELFFEKHNIYDWIFKINRQKCSCGECDYRKKSISISKYYLKNAKIDDMVNTILHEIAHVLTPRHHHDKIWKSVALSIGATGNRVHKTAKRIKGNVRYKCPKCGKISYYHRTLKRLKACRQCCEKYGEGKFDARFRMEKM